MDKIILRAYSSQAGRIHFYFSRPLISQTKQTEAVSHTGCPKAVLGIFNSNDMCNFPSPLMCHDPTWARVVATKANRHISSKKIHCNPCLLFSEFMWKMCRFLPCPCLNFFVRLQDGEKGDVCTYIVVTVYVAVQKATKATGGFLVPAEGTVDREE